jgi:hypothetical protein
MNKVVKEMFWDDLKENFKFVKKNFRLILKRTWLDFVREMKEE